MPSQNRIAAKFEELADRGERALICYVVAGYPDILGSQRVTESLIAGGADIIEIGIPFSDPIADGPTIQSASNKALLRGTKPEDALRLAARIRKKHPATPLLVMTYYNILHRAGVEEFMRRCKKNGVDGFIIPDLPVEEGAEYVAAASKLDLATVFLVSPNTPPERLERIVKSTSGFLYLVSVFGITGARDSFEDYTRNAVRRVKEAAGTRVPLAVGFGIGTPAHAKYMITAGADAVIVGSAIVDKISRSNGVNHSTLRQLEVYAKSMKKTCRMR